MAGPFIPAVFMWGNVPEQEGPYCRGNRHRKPLLLARNDRGPPAYEGGSITVGQTTVDILARTGVKAGPLIAALHTLEPASSAATPTGVWHRAPHHPALGHRIAIGPYP